MISYRCTSWTVVGPLFTVLWLGLLGGPADGAPQAPSTVTGMEYSNAPDEDAVGVADPHQVVGFDGLGGAADTVDFTPIVPAPLQNEAELDALGMFLDRFYVEVSHDDKVTLLASFTGVSDIYYSSPVADAPVHATSPKVGVWATPATINSAAPPDDVDGLEVWGPKAPYTDVNRFSLTGDPATPGGPRVSVWNYVTSGSATPFLLASEIAAAIGREDLATTIDLDAMMVRDSSPADGSSLGKFDFAGDVDAGLPPDSIMFSIAPIDTFDGGEIWVWDYAGPGSSAAYLVHGGEKWDTAHKVAEHFNQDAQIEDINALEAIPEPATLALLALGGLGLVRNRRRR